MSRPLSQLDPRLFDMSQKNSATEKHEYPDIEINKLYCYLNCLLTSRRNH